MSEDLDHAYRSLRTACSERGGVGLTERRDGLRRLRAAVRSNAEAFAQAIDADFGGRSRHETLIAEIATVLGALNHAVPRLRRWAAPEKVSVGWRFWPARGRIDKQPLGVAGIMAPSNFPVQLTLLPLIGAVAAGCRVLIKPSELAPRTADLLGRCLGDVFPPDHVGVVNGGPEVAAAMAALPLDALLFTGSTANGRRVMAAAAPNLTPLILELGGKSPVVIDVDADLPAAARSIMAGKLMNAGQTCVAPDYVLVPRPARDAFVAAARDAARALYPDPMGPGYTAVRDEAARRRLADLAQGHRLVPLFDGPVEPPKVAPALVLDPSRTSRIMREEIFGPLLPVLPYDSQEEVTAQIASLPPPLAIYWFGRNGTRLAHLLDGTMSGTVSVNETVLHAAVEALPFGGIGASGLGAYHGRAGFDAFTHRRSVFIQSRLSLTRLLKPPYGRKDERIIDLLLR